ncbi:hypothetical protein HanHA300_Chr02g0058231 [Helianthus annuus]|nr:hypothetical protein HanHA300_Chr02g0058231 [Helianthus annuus]KAJ0777481.1 hypothetical protein HanLR1_Chr02g0060971 [Helianthus annuus]
MKIGKKKGMGSCLLDTVRKCESQIDASWTALKTWKSGYKSYLNKEDILFQ